MPDKPASDSGERQLLTLEPPFYLPAALPQRVRDSLIREAGTPACLLFPREALGDDQFCAALNDALHSSLEGQLT